MQLLVKHILESELIAERTSFLRLKRTLKEESKWLQVKLERHRTPKMVILRWKDIYIYIYICVCVCVSSVPVKIFINIYK